jgi:hypothetical protein
MIKHVFRFSDCVDYSVLNGRDAIYLDMNIWIEFVNEKSILAKDLKELIRMLVKEKKIFCPLHFPLLCELYIQKPESMEVIGDLMNEFSLNFCFARGEEIWKEEVSNFVYSFLENKNHEVSLQTLFVPYIGYLSPQGSLEYPDEYNEETAEKVPQTIKNNLHIVTLPKMIELSQCFKDREVQNYSGKINSEWKKIWDHFKGGKNKIRIENQNYLANEFILPTIKRINSTLSPNNLFKLTKYITSLPKDSNGSVFNSIIDKMPSLRNYCELFSIAALDDQRKVSMNDFYDLEHLVIPLAYSDVFVARDK